MLPERGMEVRTGGQGGVKSVNVRQAAGNHRIGINKEEIPLHILPHAGFQEAGALHGRQGRIERRHHHLVKKGPENPVLGSSGAQRRFRHRIRKEGKAGIGIMPAGRRGRHQRLFKVNIGPGTYQHI